MHEFAKKMKILEINPRSPLIQGLLRRVEQLTPDEEEHDAEGEQELKEVTSILIDSALVRSGFEVTDSHKYAVHFVFKRNLKISPSDILHASTEFSGVP
jgi:heat shock protein beta